MPALKTFYYLSPIEVDLLVPRVPKGQLDELAIPRLCLNASIQGCLISLGRNKDIAGDCFKVYTITTDEYYTPSLKEAPDKNIVETAWLQKAFEPDYLYDIEVTGKSSERLEDLDDQLLMIPQWSYRIIDTSLQEDTRTLLVSKSRNAGPYKNQDRGKNRFERKKHSQIAKTVKQYNKIDMNKLFKQDILEVAIPIAGETDNYTVNIRMEGVVKEIAQNIKNNKNKLEFRTIIQSLTKVFNTTNIFIKCSCPDFKYRFAHHLIVNQISFDDSSNDPGPGKGIANPKDDKGRGCKHCLLVLANGAWLMKVASVILNYCHFISEKKPAAFLKLMFPKLYGVPADEADQNGIVESNDDLDSGKDLIDVINDWARIRGRFQKGSNKNPTTGTGGRTKKSIEKSPEENTKEASENDTEPGSSNEKEEKK